MKECYLIRRLSIGTELEKADVERLELIIEREQFVEAGTDLIREGDTPGHLHLVSAGYACRYKALADGRRAIMALLLPGDICDLHVAILGKTDHSIGTLVDCRISRILRDDLESLLECPRIGRSFWWAKLVDEAVLREWLVNVGRRPSNKQLGHLFCETYERLRAVGLTKNQEFWMPFTQATLADMLGVHAVHVQRVMSDLRERNLIALQNRMIRFPDYQALVDFVEFDPAYLHLDRPERVRSEP